MPPVFGPGVAVVDRACGPGPEGSGTIVSPVGDGQDRGLLAREELLDHHPVAGLAELALGHHEVQRRAAPRPPAADDHALARGQAVGLDHDRHAGAAQVVRRLGAGR